MTKSLVIASILSLFAATSFAQAAVDPVHKAPTHAMDTKAGAHHHKHSHHGKKHHGAKAMTPAAGASEAK